ncbi:MAG: ABC transporter substrate-binding protein [Propionicimonas sp.]|nr:ABC transporter substrate-binding protein [Propionicimonas sp.]
MFSRKPKGLSLVAAGIATALLLAGCGSNPAPSTSSSAGGGSAPAAQTTIDLWSWNPDEKTAVSYIEAFEKENPTIKVTPRFIQYSDYVNTVQLALQSGSGPDVFGIQVGALTNQFAPLSEDLAPALEAKLGADWKDKLTATDQLAVDGKQVGAPWMITGGGLIWANQTLVDSLGLKVPTTMAELKTFCRAVKDAGKACMLQGAKDAWQNIDVYQSIINQIAPGEFYKALAGQADFSGPDFVKAFDIWKSFFDDGIFIDGALGMTGYPDANDAFKKGEGALIAFGSWQNADTTNKRLAEYAESYGDAFDPNTVFMPYFFPQVVDGGTTGTMFGGPDVGFAVASSSDAKEAAETFVTWLSASETGQKLMAKTVQQPALKSVPLDLSDVTTDAQKAALEAQGPALADMIGARQIDSADVNTALGDALSAVASGQQSSADAAKAVQAAIAG